MAQLLTTPATGGPRDRPTIVLAHGAGAGMTSPFMGQIAERVAGLGLDVVRFEFAYMAGRASTGKRTPPPKAERLVDEYRAVIDGLARKGPLLIGGKSMGGRVASLIADELFAAGQIAGLVCLGYPFHPPAKPTQLRTVHLAGLRCPTLIVQGEKDPFGTRADCAGYALSSSIRWHWVAGAGHDLAPPAAPGLTRAQAAQAALTAVADQIARFAASPDRHP